MLFPFFITKMFETVSTHLFESGRNIRPEKWDKTICLIYERTYWISSVTNVECRNLISLLSLTDRQFVYRTFMIYQLLVFLYNTITINHMMLPQILISNF